MTYQYVYTPTFHQFSDNIIIWKSIKHHRYTYDHHYRQGLNIQYPTTSITFNLIALHISMLLSTILRLQERPSWKHRTSVLLPVLVYALVFFMISVLTNLVSGRQLNIARLASTTTSTSPSTEILPEDSHYITSTMSDDCVSSGKNQIAPSWCLDTSGTPRFIGAGSDDIHRTKDGTVAEKKYRNHAGFEKCLANKHIIIMGDSRVRYQYMALAHFLKTGQWMKCADYDSLLVNHTVSPSCFLINEHLHQPITWSDWYISSTKLLQHNTKQQELCDCRRETAFDPKTTNENRYLRRHTPFGLVQVTFLQNFNNELKFHGDFPPFSEFSLPTNRTNHRCSPGLCSHPFTYISDTKTAMAEVVPMLRPTHVFVDVGWDQDLDDKEFGCVLDRFRRQNPGHEAAFVITHPGTRVTTRLRRPFRGDSLPEQGCNASVFDRFTPTNGLPNSWFSDDVHLLSIVNQEFNHMMLDKICGGPSGIATENNFPK